MSAASDQLIETIRDGVIGQDRCLEGPFGPRRVTYADYTASGRSLAFLEDFMRREVMPLYANTHTETSATGLQTTRLREQARQQIREAVGANEDYAVIFCGSGATGAIHKLIAVMNLCLPADLDDRYALKARIPEQERPVVFVGPYEHHSNELPWRESIAEVVVVAEDSQGRIDLRHLERELERHASRSLKIGSFSAASNVTGIESDARAVTMLLHRHGALAFWDYAAAGPYLRIRMVAERGQPLADLDAVFLSPHKFVGGPGTPGVLVARRSLFRNRVPSVPGGGTVSYVNPSEHRYISDPEHREEGGTPAILESIRAGLVFQLKEAVGPERIAALETGFVRRAIDSWTQNPAIRILGNHSAPRLSIISFLLKHGDGHLHHNFVVALLNDLFGVQARGGCSCAGPYGHRLLGIDLATSREFESEVLTGDEGIKPGWVRVNFNYFISETSFDFILKAVDFVASHGYKLLPQYCFDAKTGQWWHRVGRPEPPVCLKKVSYASGEMSYPSRHLTAPESVLAGYLEEARAIVDAAVAGCAQEKLEPPCFSAEFERLRWFPLPHEVLAELHGETLRTPAANLIHV
jgi:selenocysteine lyase/cysteine desulfurase